jgi:cellulose synthase/poly-beta-1,6-N-acetylglucosamine synthase-like glycosyltransferase
MTGFGLILLALPYVFFPLGMALLAGFGRKRKPALLLDDPDCPAVDVVVAAYNEEKVIDNLLNSLVLSDYPVDRLRIWVGSDLSTDQTDVLVQKWSAQDPRIQLVRMEQRTGKSGIINRLVNLGNGDLVVGTDANIVFAPDTLRRLASTLLHRKAGVVGGRLIYRSASLPNTTKPADGSIAQEERTYTAFESRLKQAESDLFGAAMGVEGGCYMVQRALWKPIPPATFMEDFFISMQVLSVGMPVLWDGNALAYEDVSTDRKEEFARKTRISLGNFQNLARFWSLLFQKPIPVGILFFLHKVLRWVFPLSALFVLGSAVSRLIYGNSTDWDWVALSGWAVAGISFLSLYVWPSGVRNPLKPVGYFVALNGALLLGLYRYLRGVKSSVWTPTKRTT